MNEKERRTERVAVDTQAVADLRVHMKNEDEEKAVQRRWHWGKEVPIALVGGLILNAAGIVWGAATLNNKVENQKDVVATAVTVQSAIDRRQDEEMRRSEDRIMARLGEMDSKLNRIIEKGVFK